MAPLAGVRVIEFCNVAAGPFCGSLLADMGADVIKVEHPVGGDTLRAWPPITDGFSENFASVNRNKRSVALDLKDSAHLAKARELVMTADVVLESNRPGVMKRLGLDYEAFRKDKPALVYCSISAFGQEGPRSREGGFDLTMQAMSGTMSVTGEPDGPPVKCGVPLSDFGTGLYAAFAIAALLNRVKAGGEGGHVDASMLGCSLGMAALQTSEYFGNGRDPVKLGSAHPRAAPYQAFRANDGYFAMACGNDKLFGSACEVIGCTALTNDPRFASNALRAKNQVALRDALEVEFRKHSCADWLARLAAANVPCAPINTYSQALADPQVKHMEWVQEITLPGGTRTRTFASPIRISGQGLPITRNPPALGEHTAEMLAELERAEPRVTQPARQD